LDTRRHILASIGPSEPEVMTLRFQYYRWITYEERTKWEAQTGTLWRGVA
jgi:hypothetical protein